MTTTLFTFDSDDTAPEDAGGKKARKKAAPSVVADEPSPVQQPPAPEKPHRILGEVQDVACLCGTSWWEILEDHRNWWVVWCMACFRQRCMDAVPGVLPERSDFVVHDGRFAGMTLDEIAEQPRGIDTIKVYAKGHKSPAVQAAAKKFLDDRGVSR